MGNTHKRNTYFAHNHTHINVTENGTENDELLFVPETDGLCEETGKTVLTQEDLEKTVSDYQSENKTYERRLIKAYELSLKVAKLDVDLTGLLEKYKAEWDFLKDEFKCLSAGLVQINLKKLQKV